MAPKKKKKAEQEKKGKEPEQQQQQERESEGVAESILRALGDMIPGVGGLIKGLEKSEAFRERLREVEEEIEAQLRETPLKSTAEERGRRPRPPGSIPRRAVKKGERVARVKREKEVSADVFDEGDYLRVIAEMPGVEEKDIRVDLKSDTLIISADTVSHKYRREVRLPCTPREILKTAYRNGVLEIVLKKTKT